MTKTGRTRPAEATYEKTDPKRREEHTDTAKKNLAVAVPTRRRPWRQRHPDLCAQRRHPADRLPVWSSARKTSGGDKGGVGRRKKTESTSAVDQRDASAPSKNHTFRQDKTFSGDDARQESMQNGDRGSFSCSGRCGQDCGLYTAFLTTAPAPKLSRLPRWTPPGFPRDHDTGCREPCTTGDFISRQPRDLVSEIVGKCGFEANRPRDQVSRPGSAQSQVGTLRGTVLCGSSPPRKAPLFVVPTRHRAMR